MTLEGDGAVIANNLPVVIKDILKVTPNLTVHDIKQRIKQATGEDVGVMDIRKQLQIRMGIFRLTNGLWGLVPTAIQRMNPPKIEVSPTELRELNKKQQNVIPMTEEELEKMKKMKLSEGMILLFSKMKLSAEQWEMAVQLIPKAITQELSGSGGVEVEISGYNHKDELDKAVESITAGFEKYQEHMDALMDEFTTGVNDVWDVAKLKWNKFGTAVDEQLRSLEERISELAPPDTTNVSFAVKEEEEEKEEEKETPAVIEPTADYLNPPAAVEEENFSEGMLAVADGILAQIESSKGRHDDIIYKSKVIKHVWELGVSLSESSLDVYSLGMMKAIAWKWNRLFNYRSRKGLVPVKHNIAYEKKMPNKKQIVRAYRSWMKR